VNLYYEFNNPLLDWVFSEKSNLKCALYGDVHTAAEKTNCGGQQQAPEGWDTTYIQKSTGWAAKFEDPATPQGYELVFGPEDGANNAPGVRTSTCSTFLLLFMSCSLLSTWASSSFLHTMLMPVRQSVTSVVLIAPVVPASTSISGGLSSTMFQQLTLAQW
jgi:hypothetical protein